MQSRDLDTNHLNSSQTQAINEKCIIGDSGIAVNESESQTENKLSSDMEIKEKSNVMITENLIPDNESADQSEQQKIEANDNNDDIGNDRQLINNFDNESQINATNSELLEHSVCQSDRETDPTSDKTHYQNKDQSNYNEDVSHRNEPELENLNQSFDTNTNSDILEETQIQIIQKTTRCYSVVEKIEEITDEIINEAINEQKNRKFSLNNLKNNESNFDKQTSVQKTLSQTTLTSNESNKISDAKSTIGSLRSENFGNRSVNSGYSRKSSSKSLKSTKSTNIPIINKRKHKERETHRKVCLKPVVDIEPLDTAINRKKFKRLRVRIPPKSVINIPIDEIKKRWRDIKTSEMKKVFLFSEHKQQELSSGFILWYELNKNFKNRNKSFDSQIDKYIEENRKSLHRTLSDSYLNRHKFIKI